MGDGDVLDTTGGSDARVLYEWVKKSNDRHEPHHILEDSGESATRVVMEKQTDQKECSICGDVGFPEELFLCHKRRKRFQHSLYDLIDRNDRHEPHHILEHSGESATRVVMEKQTDQKECSICGDVGFPEELFLCHKCRKRFQHRYCSRWYLKLSPQARNWVCEWCLSAAAPESDSGKPMIITSAVTPCKAVQLRLIADDDRAKNSNKRSCALDDVQLDHQAGSNGAILKRRRKSSSSQRVIAGISASGSSRRFRSLQSLLWIME